jgi:hypothetical protein
MVVIDAACRGVDHLEALPDDVPTDRRVGGPRARMPSAEEVIGVAVYVGRISRPHQFLGRAGLPFAMV